MNKTLKNIIYTLLHGVGFVLLYFVVKDIDFKAFLNLLAKIPVWKILLGFAFLVLVYILKSFRWMLINRNLVINIPFRQTFVIYLVSGFLSTITPGRIGEFAKIFILKRNYKIDYSRSTSSVILDRVWDILVLSMMAVISVPIFYGKDQFPGISLVLISGFFLLSLLLIIFPNLFFSPLIFIFRKRQKLRKRLEVLLEAWKGKNPAGLFISFLLSTISFLILAFIPLFFSAELGAPVPIQAGVGAVSLSNMLSYIPITIAGFGTRELVFINFWTTLSYSKELAISVSSLQFIFTYFGTLLFGGFLYIIRFRKLIRVKDLKEGENIT